MDYRKTMNRLNIALSRIDAAYAIIAKQNGLTYNALMIIYLINERTNITQKSICDELYLTKSTVHSILLDFIHQGYVTLSTGNNKKEKFINTTDSGKSYFADLIKQTQTIEKNVLEALGSNTCAFLTETVEAAGSLLMAEVTKINDNKEDNYEYWI